LSGSGLGLLLRSFLLYRFPLLFGHRATRRFVGQLGILWLQDLGGSRSLDSTPRGRFRPGTGEVRRRSSVSSTSASSSVLWCRRDQPCRHARVTRWHIPARDALGGPPWTFGRLRMCCRTTS
jgi:hypothetical protein